VSPEAPDAVELVLEPTGFPFAQTYQKELFDAGIPVTMLFADDVEQEYARLRRLGVVFTGEPVRNEYGVQATFDDTCGNLILLQQE
jgi:predicted enzyme related to lactoylglutathione lyase